MELNRDDVIKALECCTKPNCVGFECPLYGDQAACVTGLNIAALSLINELTEENERLRGCVMSEEEVRIIANETIKQCISIIKADTVRKMQERLNETKFKMMGDYFIYAQNVDQIADEIIGETNDHS